MKKALALLIIGLIVSSTFSILMSGVKAEETELYYDDSEMDRSESILGSFGGYAVRFTPTSTPWVLKEVKVYGCYEPSGASTGTFYIRVWDANLVTLWEAGYQYGDYFNYRWYGGYGWATVSIPDVTVSGDFYVVFFPNSIEPTQYVWMGIDIDPPISGRSSDASIAYGNYVYSPYNNLEWMIRAVGSPIAPPPPIITVNPNGGKIFVDGSPISIQTSYSWSMGSAHTLDPESPYEPTSETRLIFTQWSDGDTSDPRTITVSGDATYTALWKTQYQLTISVSPSGGGTTNPSPGSYWQDSGTLVTVSETPNTGYTFSHWELDGINVGSGTLYTVTMDAPYTLIAFFTPLIEELLSLPAPSYYWHGELTGTATILEYIDKQVVTASPGETLTFTATYHIWAVEVPAEIKQAFFIVSWTPSWPPPQGYYIPLYDGIPGLSPGITETKTFSFTVPQTPGTYYLWWCGESHYSMEQAVAHYTTPLSLPAHVKIVVPPAAPYVCYNHYPYLVFGSQAELDAHVASVHGGWIEYNKRFAFGLHDWNVFSRVGEVCLKYWRVGEELGNERIPSEPQIGPYQGFSPWSGEAYVSNPYTDKIVVIVGFNQYGDHMENVWLEPKGTPEEFDKGWVSDINKWIVELRFKPIEIGAPIAGAEISFIDENGDSVPGLKDYEAVYTDLGAPVYARGKMNVKVKVTVSGGNPPFDFYYSLLNVPSGFQLQGSDTDHDDIIEVPFSIYSEAPVGRYELTLDVKDSVGQTFHVTPKIIYVIFNYLDFPAKIKGYVDKGISKITAHADIFEPTQTIIDINQVAYIMHHRAPTVFVEAIKKIDGYTSVSAAVKTLARATDDYLNQVTQEGVPGFVLDVKTDIIDKVIQTLSKVDGDCKHFSALFVGLSRSVGISSRLVSAFFKKTDNLVSGHQWAETWYDNTWWVIDPTHADLVLGNLMDKFSVLSLMSKLSLFHFEKYLLKDLAVRETVSEDEEKALDYLLPYVTGIGVNDVNRRSMLRYQYFYPERGAELTGPTISFLVTATDENGPPSVYLKVTRRVDGVVIYDSLMSYQGDTTSGLSVFLPGPNSYLFKADFQITVAGTYEVFIKSDDSDEGEDIYYFPIWVSTISSVSMLQIEAKSPVNILVTNPQGRRVGYDPGTGTVVNEVPGATYSGAGSEPQIVTISNPIAGNYKIDAYGISSGTFTITVETFAFDGSVISSIGVTGTAIPGETYTCECQMSSDGSLTTPPPEIPEFSFATAIITSIGTVLYLLFRRRLSLTVQKLRRKK